jgi:hypothetical protein
MRFASATLLALLCAGPAVADPGPLAVVVRGAPDAASVRARIASELGAPIVAIDRCTGACLEISITGSTANVAYTTADGVTRARLLELGSEKAQWPIVIALLAGNLARDEAADVLAQLPPPPAPAPEAPEQGPVLPPDAEAPQVVIPPAVAPRPPVAYPAPYPMDLLYEQRREEMAIAVGLVPGLSTDGLRIGRVRHLVSFHGLAGISGGSELLAFSGLADVQRGTVNGVQLSGIASVARDLRGVQVGGILAIAERGGGVQVGGIAAATRGRADFQLGGIGAIADSSSLAQIGGVATLARHSASTQVAGIAAFAGDNSDFQLGGIGVLTRGRAHVQVAGIAAVAGGAELQVAGIAAVSRGEGHIQIGGIATSAGVANVQVAGIANVADRVRGVQVGTVNIARRVEGLQVGVVNIGGNAGGNSFGLINIVPGGRTDLEASVDSDKIGMVLFRHGGHNWHNVYGVAGQQIDEGERSTDDVWMYGLGFGPSWRSRSSRVDLELMGWQVNHGANHSTDVSILGQLRATYAHQLGSNLSLIGGGAINAYISDDQMSPFSLERRTDGGTPAPDVTVTVWPSAFVGVRM